MRPFGYEPDRTTVRAHEAKILQEAARALLAGESLRSVTMKINEGGSTTPGGNSWKPNVLRRVLVSPRVAGKVAAQDDQLVDAGWPGILDMDTHQRLVELFQDESRRTSTASRSAARIYLLTGGIARCGICGSPLIARPNNDGKRGYVCTSGPPYNGCGKIRINAEPFENDVVERMLAMLLRDDAREKLRTALDAAREAADQAPATIKEAERRLKEIGVDYADGLIGATELRAARDRLQERIRDARTAINLGSTLDNVAALEAKDLVAWWEGASLSQQRALLDVMVDRIEVLPVVTRGSKIFDPSRVKVTWRRF